MAATPTRTTIIPFPASGIAIAITKPAAGQPRSRTVASSSPAPVTTPRRATGSPAIPAAATVRSVVFAFLGGPALNNVGTISEVALRVIHWGQGFPLSVLAGLTTEGMIGTLAHVAGGHALGELLEIDVEDAE
ncbi:hypothetical protein PM082_023133 [Marasmius tenuissimus]|nr:hypothetical protein PM082_023133 [Marasmius tenuissimus]